MDSLDREILAVLREDARTPFTEVAERVGTSEGTIRNRVERMLDDGVIERFTVATRTGNVKAMIEIGVAADVDTREISDRMADWDQVDFVWQVSGDEDVVLVVDATDTQGVNNLLRRARDLDEVVSTKTRLILEERIG